MYRTYLAYALVALGFYSYSQAKGWTLFGTEAQRFAAMRAADAESRSGSSSGRSGGSFSGK